MARKPKSESTPDLIPDVRPENEKAILKRLKAWETARDEAHDANQVKGTKHDELIEEVMAAGIQPNADGSFQFTIDDLEISVPAPKRSIRIKRKKATDDREVKGDDPNE